MRMVLEKADISRGKIGIELELLLRADLFLAGNDPSQLAAVHRPWSRVNAEDGEVLTRQAAETFGLSGFSYSIDRSVHSNLQSVEYYYGAIELKSSSPATWRLQSTKLNRLLSWLKHRDVVYISRNHPKVSTVQSNGSKRLVLQRGLVPSNYSGGLHLHFDVDSWFDGPEHADRFINLWQKFQRDIPAYVVPARYKGRDSMLRGHEYAKVTGKYTPGHRIKGLEQSTPASVVLKGANKSRESSLNTTKATTRGDIEFRFMHSTLNFATIEGWVMSIAELIEQSSDGESHNQDYRSYLDTNNQDARRFLSRTAYRMSRTDYDGPSGKASRLVRRLTSTPPETSDDGLI